MADTQLSPLHIVLGVAVVLLVLYLLRSKGCGMKEGMCVDKCHCNQCAQACARMKLAGHLYGCNRNCPTYNPAVCELSYRKCLLHGCNVAGVL